MMHLYIKNTLKLLHKTFSIIFLKTKIRKTNCELDINITHKLIYDILEQEKPCMIARFGSTELTCMHNYLGVKKNSIKKYIYGETGPIWWNKKIIIQMQNWSGFFPATEKKIEQFCELMLEEIPEVDILGSWQNLESRFESYLKATKIHFHFLEPFWCDKPWTKALEGKKVLVVHPFEKTIRSQYVRRELLFNNDKILPKFKSFDTIKAVQSLGQGDPRFRDWFEALDFMKTEIDKFDYDICLIGAGAYGFPLAAHVKRRGKKAIHLGGALQLLFGIRGNRWEDSNYGVKKWGIPKGSYTNLINEHWVRPDEDEKPKNAVMVEGECYW